MSDNQVYFCISDNIVDIVTLNTATTFTEIPPALYSLMHNDVRGFHLSNNSKGFEVPDSIFGGIPKRVEHVFKRYDSQTSSLGVLLTGSKGSGKSLFATLIGNEMLKRGLPVIMINDKYYGQELNEFLNKIGECVIIFDEFAKVYGNHDQSKMLTLFDGMMSSKRIIVVTENEKHSLNDFIINRPGRFMYHYRYDKLEEEVVIEYCTHMNVGEIIDDCISIRRRSREFSMDSLSAIVSEYLMFGKDTNAKLDDIIENLNIPSNTEPNIRIHLKKIVQESNDHVAEIDRNFKHSTTFVIPSMIDFGFNVEMDASMFASEGDIHSSDSGMRSGGLVSASTSSDYYDNDEGNADNETYNFFLHEGRIKWNDGKNLVCSVDGYSFVFTIEDEVADLWTKYSKLV